MKLETIKIGRIVNAHGIRGEVRVQPRDLDPNLLTRFDTFLLDGQPVKPSANHVHKSVVLMKFPGVDDMNAALNLKGKDLYIRRDDADSSECLGELVRVEQYPAHRVYTVRGTHEYLIPAVPDVFIKSVDLDANRMEVHTLEGMATDAD